MTTTFASVSSALEADMKAVRLKVWIAGRLTQVFEAHPIHDVNRPIGTCTLVLAAPLPSHVTINATVLVQAGYQGAVRTIFSGRIPSYGAAIDERGKTARVNAVGWASLLDYEDFADLRFSGPISLKRIFQSLCRRRNVPAYRAQEVYTVDGAVVRLGGVEEVDSGDLVISRTTSPLSWLAQKAELFGYRVFDTPVGRVLLSRVSGLPDGDAAATYAEGVNAYRFESSLDTRPMVTYWEVFGAKYTDANGATVAIRSIPDEVPYSAELDPPGYRRDKKTDGALVNLQLAQAVRNVMETDYSTPAEITTWEVDGAPDRQPGDVVSVESDTCAATGLRWLTSITQSVQDRQGYYATMTGWSGAGEALPAGDDCIDVTVSTSTYHVGNESLSYYDDPSPDGLEVTISFTIPDEDYSSLTITADAHGANGFYVGSINEDSEASRFEVWQLPEPSEAASDDNKLRKVGDGQLPIMEESSDAVAWQEIVIPITGSVKAGAAELRLISGYDADVGDYDDFEVKNLVMVVCGVGEPDLPSEVS